MKKFFYTLLALGFLCVATSAQVVYVSQDATGSNDGSSWDNAYTSLHTALENTETGEIWVASGTYLPGGEMPDTMSRFWIRGSLSLYGGFAGTETDLSERDLSANETILSGDLSQDDMAGDFDNNKEDNALHVIYVDSLIEGTVLIDGFSISGGHNNPSLDGFSDYFWRGGGIYSLSTIDVNNCRFTHNFSNSGAGVYVFGIGAAGSRFENCTFEENLAFSQAALFVNETEDCTVMSCDFLNNTINRGALYPADCTNTLITGCRFEGNVNPTGTGGAMFSWQNNGLTIRDCEFINNQAETAGVIYIDGREFTNYQALEPDLTLFENCLFDGNTSNTWGGTIYTWQSPNLRITNCEFANNVAQNGGCFYLDGRSFSDNQFLEPGLLVIENCTFEDNTAQDWGGGAIYNWKSSYIMTNCSFSGHSAGNTGGTIYNGGDGGKEYVVEDCVFEDGEAGWGAGIANYGFLTTARYVDCTFGGNASATSGGAMINGFRANVFVESCDFEQNNAGWGGAMYLQNDSTSVSVKGSFFTGNTSSNSGGAINMFGGIFFEVDSCNFEANQSDFGAAIAVGEDGGEESPDIARFDLKNSIFNFNFAESQAGAVNISNVDVDITSCLFINNAATDTGTGGAISINASDTTTVNVNILNSTLAFNQGELAGGIAQWTEGIGEANLSVQNVLFFNPGSPNYAIEDGSPTLVSNGGNMSSDETLSDYLTHEKDLIDVGLDPLFVDPDNFDFHLLEGSPCIDAGVSEGAPEFDIEGNPRVGPVDCGAYEFQMDTRTREEVLVNDGALSVAPNPVLATSILKLENEWRGEVQLRITNLLGQNIMIQRLEKHTVIMEHPLRLSSLESGTYQVSVTNGKAVITQKVVVP